MSNTVSIRIKGNSTSKAVNQLAHDMRIKQVNYLKSSSQKNLLVTPDEKIIYSQDESDKKLFEKLKAELLKSSGEQKEIHEKSIGQKSQVKNYFINGIITFSTDMQKDFYKNQEKFQELTKKTLDDFSKKFGVKLLNHSIHLDEKTPHIHFCFENINRSNGKSVQRYISKLDLKNLQTLTGSHWEEMGYKRGKEGSGKKHYSVAVGHEKERLENLKNQIQEQKKLIKSYDIETSQKKTELDKLDVVLKATRKQIKEIKNLTELDSKIEADIDQIIKDSKKLFVLKEDLVRENLKEVLKTYSKINFKSLQEQKLEKDVELLTNDYNELVNDYNTIASSYDDLRTKHSTLNQQNEKLVSENNIINSTNLSLANDVRELREDISYLEKDFKFNYQTWKDNRKSNYEKMKEQRENIRRNYH